MKTNQRDVPFNDGDKRQCHVGLVCRPRTYGLRTASPPRLAPPNVPHSMV